MGILVVVAKTGGGPLLAVPSVQVWEEVKSMHYTDVAITAAEIVDAAGNGFGSRPQRLLGCERTRFCADS